MAEQGLRAVKAVCYAGTTGHLFSAVLSATQARQHVSDAVQVIVVALADAETPETRTLREVCEAHGVLMVRKPTSVLQGRHPMFARLHLDDVLPPAIDDVLYLDGDTQVIGTLDPLMAAVPPEGWVLAVRDPMVFIRELGHRHRRRIDAWWDGSGIPGPVRRTYVNSGVLRASRATVADLRGRVDELVLEGEHVHRFPDQDAINTVLGGRVEAISMRWNFPGFLLGTRLEEVIDPHIVHFMSEPRPWHAPLSPWGREYFAPYAALARMHPAVTDSWPRLRARRLCRYWLQQQYKALTERRTWQSLAATSAVEELERSTRPLA